MVDSDITTESVPKQATKSSTKKGKSSTKSPPQKFNGKRTGRSALSQTPVVINKTMSVGDKGFPQLYPPIAKSVVVVESVTKAKVIQGYLGEMYEVLPSYGHVRDLAARSGSVRPDDDFSMVWEVPSPAWTHLKSIKVALSGYVTFRLLTFGCITILLSHLLLNLFLCLKATRFRVMDLLMS